MAVDWTPVDIVVLALFTLLSVYALMVTFFVHRRTRIKTLFDQPTQRSFIAFFFLWFVLSILRSVEFALYVGSDVSFFLQSTEANAAISSLDSIGTWLIYFLLSVVVSVWGMLIYRFSRRLVTVVCAIGNVISAAVLAALDVYGLNSNDPDPWRPWELFVAIWTTVAATLFLVFGVALFRKLFVSLRNVGMDKATAKKELRSLGVLIVVLELSLVETAIFRCLLAFARTWSESYPILYALHRIIGEIGPALVIITGLARQIDSFVSQNAVRVITQASIRHNQEFGDISLKQIP